MDFAKFGFIGTGNMGSALARTVVSVIGGQNVILSDKTTIKAEALAEELSCDSAEISEVALTAKYIFLGVKPQVLPDLLAAIKPYLQKRADRFILVSMAAGVKIDTILETLDEKYPIIRIMPNTPVSVGKGMILYTYSGNISVEELDEFKNALSLSGKLDKINEGLIDAATAVSGSGPAFACMFAEAIADAGVEAGLTREKALLYAAQMLSGTAELILSSNKNPADLKNDVCSPGGSTIAGVHALEAGRFRGTVMNAVKATFDRTRELGK